MEDLTYKPRRPILAAFLSLVGGALGQLYAGRGRRFLVLTAVSLILLPVVTGVTLALPVSRLAFVLLMLSYLVWPLFLCVDAFRCAKQARQQQLNWYQRWWIYPLVYIGFAGVSMGVSHLERAFVFEAFVMPTGSMEPTIVSGDRILVSKLVSQSEGIAHGNVVVFRSWEPDRTMRVKRVIAIAGDTIEIKNEVVFLNGEEIDEPYAKFEGDQSGFDQLVNTKRTTVPPGHFFVLGDHRRNSLDSRMSGPVPISDFCGQAVRIYWSRPRTWVELPRPGDYQTGPIAWDRIGMQIQ